MKYVLVIGDGMADNPVPELGDKTPLQYANIPCMDWLAAHGEVGNIKTCPDALPPGSDTGILSIMGADPLKTYSGRSPLEAAATGIKLEADEVSYRCNMIALEDADLPYPEKKILSHSGGSIEGDQSMELVTYLFADPTFKAAADKIGMRVYPAPSFRHIAVQKNGDLKNISLKAPHDFLGKPIGPILPSGNANAEDLNNLMEIAHGVLNHHPINEARRKAGKLPANGVWFWAEGSAVILESFQKKYGKTGCMISAVPLCQGISNLAGVDVRMVEGATGELDTNYEGKAAAALEELKSHDLVVVHLEAPDECTHNGDTKGKLQSIEWLDSRIIQPIVDGLKDTEFRILVMPDHKTLTSTRGHDGEPIPYVLYDSRKDTGLNLPYNEESGAKGPAYAHGADTIMPLLFEQL